MKELLKEVIHAWEKLNEGDYTSQQIERWLIKDMKPVIDKIRKEV